MTEDVLREQQQGVRHRIVAPQATNRLTRRAFLAGLGLVYVAAFGSLWSQVLGLYGSGGILPVAENLERIREAAGVAAYLDIPSLLWLGASDTMLSALCAGGVGLAALLVLGFAPRLALFLLWAIYLSFCTAGAVFLNFQWDALLLETGLLAILFAPGGLRPDWRGGPEPSKWILWLLRFVLFKVMFLSGVVKLTAGDPSWWPDLTALEFHYWTQPLPHRVSHYVHHLPAWFHEASTMTMFVIELGVPFLFFCPRRLRIAGAAATAFLMLVIMGTGNYAFFEPLILVLCITLLDDGVLRCALPRRWRDRWRAAGEEGERSRARATLIGGAAAAVLLLSSLAMARTWFRGPFPSPLAELERGTDPFRSFNSYGLFRVMTKERPEIVVEGSRDSIGWRPYVFRWKPGAQGRAPGFTGVHMPRLDWQMWFAGLSGVRGAAWYPWFVRRLLEGSPEVLDLLEENPFPEGPPFYVRSTGFLYTFSSPEERAEGKWWKRELAGGYCPTLELVDGELRAVR